MRRTTIQPIRAFSFDGTLTAHQDEGADWLLDRSHAVLADDVGLGKTVTAFAYLDRLDQRGLLEPRGKRRLARVLWLTEKNLLAQAEGEARKFLPGAAIVTGESPLLGNSARAQLALAEAAKEGIDVLVLSHDMANSRRRFLDSFDFAALVVDEASNLKGGGAQANTVAALARRTPRVLTMTATPLENNPLELWQVLYSTNVPDLWAKPEFERDFVFYGRPFVDKWGREHPRPEGWIYGRVDEARRYLDRVVLRRTATDVGLNLPELTRTQRYVPLSAAQQFAYNTAGGGLSGFQRKQSASLSHSEESTLVDALITELLRQGDRQAVVYCESLTMLDLTETAMKQHGISTVRVEGKVSTQDRAEAASRFRDGEVRVFLGSSVLERGLNLQTCDLLISLDSSWNPKREQQREGRIRRIGSPHSACEHLLLSPDTPLVREGKNTTLARKLRAAELVGL